MGERLVCNQEVEGSNPFGSSGPGEAPAMKRTKNIAAAIVVLLVLIVVLQNTKAVETKLLFVSVVMPLALLLTLTLLFGFAVGVLLSDKLLGRFKRKPLAASKL